jgi:hypothetical protein
MKPKYLAFDMDGTIADLYAVDNWLEQLRAYNPNPYKVAQPMWDMDELRMALNEVQQIGIKVVIITWASKDSTREYDMAVRQAKLEWLEEMGFPYDFFHCVKYGTTKANTIRKYMEIDETAILIDDNEKVRNGWSLGETINPIDTDIIDFIRGLI